MAGIMLFTSVLMTKLRLHSRTSRRSSKSQAHQIQSFACTNLEVVLDQQVNVTGTLDLVLVLAVIEAEELVIAKAVVVAEEEVSVAAAHVAMDADEGVEVVEDSVERLVKEREHHHPQHLLAQRPDPFPSRRIVGLFYESERVLHVLHA